MGGLLAQASSKKISVEEIVATAAWWHSQAAILAAEDRTELGVDAYTLTNYLIAVLASTSTKLLH
jgi:NAD(P)H-hydrate epimerase